MPNIQLLLNDAEYGIVTAAAEKQGVPVLVYIRSRLLGTEDEFSTAYAETLRRVEALKPGTEFDLKALFGTDWTMSRKTKLMLGKTFYKQVKTKKIKLAKAKDEEHTTIMQYERL